MSDMEHASLVNAIAKASRGLNPDGTATVGAHFDEIDVLREGSRLIATEVNAAVAAELTAQSAFIWDVAKVLEGTFDVLTSNGDEQAAAVIGAQRRALVDLSMRFNRRAAQVVGVTEDELRARALLTAPGDAVFTPAADTSAAAGQVQLKPGFWLSRHDKGWLECGHQYCGEITRHDDIAAVEAWQAQHLLAGCQPAGGDVPGGNEPTGQEGEKQ